MSDLLLHVCCTPCALLPLELFQRQGLSVCAWYDNPNIHPQEEYQRRLAVFEDYAASLEVTLQAPGYQPELWEQAVAGFGGPYPLVREAPDFQTHLGLREQRCRACYRLRFESLARSARDLRITQISTTLSISPYQFTQIIAEELQRAAQLYQLQALFYDFREYYPEATERSRVANIYRQNYCGCRFSLEEAQLERQARKLYRQARKLRKAAGGGASGEAPVEAPVGSLAEAAQAPAEASAQAPAQAPAEAPAKPPAEKLAQVPTNIPAKTRPEAGQ